VNRAFATGTAQALPRRAERVPTSWPVEVRIGAKVRPSQLYSLSARGAYLATAGPALRRTLVHITLPLPSQELRVAGEVVLTNVPGNLRKRNLPIGMGVRFLGLSGEAERALTSYTTERSTQLLV
jgi:hypothetical protein